MKLTTITLACITLLAQSATARLVEPNESGVSIPPNTGLQAAYRLKNNVNEYMGGISGDLFTSITIAGSSPGSFITDYLFGSSDRGKWYCPDCNFSQMEDGSSLSVSTFITSTVNAQAFGIGKPAGWRNGDTPTGRFDHGFRHVRSHRACSGPNADTGTCACTGTCTHWRRLMRTC